MDGYKQELDVAYTLAARAAEEIRRIYFLGDFAVERKGDGTPVTTADIRANEIIVAGLQKAFPQDGIVSEELADVTGGRTWYVDPIDGTKQFVTHSDQFAIHIGLAVREKPVLGLVYKPLTDEFYAAAGKEARRARQNGSSLDYQLDLTPKKDGANLTMITNTKFIMSEIGRKVIGRLVPLKVHTSGSQGLRMIKIAEGYGHFSLINMPTLCSSWDLCAPQAIVEATGGYVGYLDGSPVKYHGQRALADDFVVAYSREMGEFISDVVNSLL